MAPNPLMRPVTWIVNHAAKMDFSSFHLSRLILMSKDSGMSGTTRSISLQTPNTTCCREGTKMQWVSSLPDIPTVSSHLKYDHEAKLESQDLPMVGGVVSLVIPKPSVPATIEVE